MRYMMLMIPKGYESAGPELDLPVDAVEKMMKYNDDLRAAGVLVAMEGLHPPSTGARVSFATGAPVVTDDYIAWNRESGGLAVSTDGGVTFDGSGPSPGRPSPTLVPGPAGTLLTSFEGGVGITADLGQTWQPVGEPLPFEADGIAYSAARGALYVWRHTCEFGEGGNPVPQASILQAVVDEVG